MLQDTPRSEKWVLEFKRNKKEKKLTFKIFDQILKIKLKNLNIHNILATLTLLKVLNKGEYDEVPAQIKRWNKAGGKVLQGLIRRREAEALHFQDK